MKERGFNLLEIIITLSIFMLTLIIVVPVYSTWIPLKQLKFTSSQISMSLNLAKCKAIFSGTKYRINFQHNSYYLEKYINEKKTWEIDGRIYHTENVSIKSNNNPVFHPDAKITSMCTIILSNKAGQIKITLAITGRIKITD
ncbi:MAG: hypothetical protein AB1410_01040 [Acidobacteriota bacterium]